MKRMAYFLLGLGVLVATALAVNNYYQTQRAKQAKSVEVTTNNQLNFGNSTKQATKTYELAVVNISGFDCPSCPAIAQSAVKNSNGVLDAKVTETGEGSRIIYDPTVTNLENVKKSLPDTYKLSLVRQETLQLQS